MASELFSFGQNSATRAVQAGSKNPDSVETLTAHSLYCIAQGLHFLSVGLRATYIKLEEIERTVKK